MPSFPGYYTHNDYGLPYHYSFDIAARVQSLAAQSHAHRVYVDGDYDPSDVMSSVLHRAGLAVFWLDDYRSPEFAAPPPSDPPAVYVTMADDTDTAQFMKANFAESQSFGQTLPGEGVTIRAYVLQPAQVLQAIDRRLTRRLDVTTPIGVRLEAIHTVARLLPETKTITADVSWTWDGAKRPLDLQYTVFGHLIDASGKAVSEVDRPMLPSPDWLAGERVVQWLNLPMPKNLSPGVYRLEIGIYDDTGPQRQPLTDGAGKVIGESLVLGPLVVAPPAPSADSTATPANITFGDGISLASYRAAAQPGKIALDLRWQASSIPSHDYTIFVHILDSQGKIAAQTDVQPQGGNFPTSAWLPGESIADPITLAVPPGHYTAEIGLYYVPTLERLPGGPLHFTIDVG